MSFMMVKSKRSGIPSWVACVRCWWKSKKSKLICSRCSGTGFEPIAFSEFYTMGEWFDEYLL